MTIWSFGGSFSITLTGVDDTWQQQLTKKLDIPINYMGLGGSSLDYTYKKFNSVRNEIEKNDILVLTLPDIDRRWFIKDKPEESNWNWVSREDRNHESMKYFLVYLNNTEPYEIYFLNFLYNLHNFTKKLNLHTILLPCFNDTLEILQKRKDQFPQFFIANGALDQINRDEFDQKFLDDYGYIKYGENDLRINHMIKSNHTILADKLLQSIKEKTNINLKDTFVKSILNRQSFKDVNFSKDELFNVHLNEWAWNYHKF